jgi:hypothetical protein
VRGSQGCILASAPKCCFLHIYYQNQHIHSPFFDGPQVCYSILYMTHKKNVAVLVLVLIPMLALWVVPIVVEAQIFGALVPTCGGNFGEDCNFCNLLGLAQRLINFFIYLSVVVATLLFTYAGILYMTSAPNPGNVEKAHKIFWNVLIGLIVVLGAWLIVDTVMKVFYSESEFGPWNAILCRAGTEFEGGGSAGEGLVSGGSAGEGLVSGSSGVMLGSPNANDSQPLSQSEAISQMGAAITGNCGFASAGTNVCITSTTGLVLDTTDGCSVATGCTTIDGLKKPLVDLITGIGTNCRGSTGINYAGCNVIITGGTETGRSTGAAQFSHDNGYKVDINKPNGTLSNTAIDRYFQDNFFNNPNAVKDSVGSWSRWSVLQPNGDLIRIIDEGNIYDVQVIPSQFEPSIAN